MKIYLKIWKNPIFKRLTVLTILSVLAISIVSGATILTFYGGKVEVVGVQLEVQYSLENETNADWSNELSNVFINQSWFSRINITDEGYNGEVEITWTLQEKIGSIWIDTENSVLTTITLSGEIGQLIYASEDGSIGANADWSSYCDDVGEYRLKVEVEID